MSLQHCPACDEEYVAGVAACAECGGPLTPGELPRLGRVTRSRERETSDEPLPEGVGLDRLLSRLPGAEADQAVRALLLEGIACRVTCAGLEKTYAPGSAPAEPFAVSLPVEIFVAGEQEEAAREVLGSLEHDDLIGEQWEHADEEAESVPLPVVTDERDVEAAAVEAGEHDQADEALQDAAPEPEGTSMRTAVLIVIVVLVLLFLFGRS